MSMMRTTGRPAAPKPRWPKPRVVRWLEWGAIPAIVGLWLPDWSGAYIAEATGDTSPLPGIAIPPLPAFLGGLVLLCAGRQAIRGPGWHSAGLRLFGLAGMIFAVLSLFLHTLRHGTTGDPWFAAEIVAIGLAVVCVAAVLWITLAGLADITGETVTAASRSAALAFTVLGLACGAAAVAAIVAGSGLWPGLLRSTLLLFTLALLMCRYALHDGHANRPMT
jgi:hypothetical protein